MEEKKTVIEARLTKEVCESFRGVRSVVMKRAHELMAEERLPFRDAIKRAWEEVKTTCLLKYGVP
jgi:hypothetical protein